MEKPLTIDWLSQAVAKATRSAKFCTVGSLVGVDPGLVVENLGPIKLPLKRTQAKELIAQCSVAPYGKGTKTLVDPKVRNTFELDPVKLALSDRWQEAIAHATQQAAVELGLPAEQLEARLYKLLVYERGGFFLPHRDSEKLDRMVASMIVVLPSRFEGGALIVRHGAVKQAIKFEEAARGDAPCFAAFYADCEHEVQSVTSGVRLCLAYNLVLTGPKSKAAARADAPDDALAESIAAWTRVRPAEPLVFALEHQYTERGLSLDLLKGGDRQLAALVVSAAEKSNSCVHLAHVSRHLLQFADDGSFERGYRYGRSSRGPITVGETYEDELLGTQWTDLDGKKQPWGDIPLEPSAIVASVPLDQWKPTSEEFEGYTGNAGNTLDRWYHRSAIVVWPRDRHFEVLAKSGPVASIPLFCSLASKLAKTPKKRIDEARLDCVRFARAIIATWRQNPGYGPPNREKSPLDDFPDVLLSLHDRDTIAMFLTMVAQRDPMRSLDSLVVGASREFGWTAFADELKALFNSPPPKWARPEIPFRDVEWLAAYCCDKAADAGKQQLAEELCTLATERFCTPPPQPTYYSPRDRREPSISEKSLPLLLKALAASGRNDDLRRVIDFVQSLPNEFDLDDCLFPSLKTLIPWSRKQLGSVPPPLTDWLNAVRSRLQAATAQEPQPPTDWARPANVECNCQYCVQLNSFLADPTAETGRIPAREDSRHHLIDMVNRHQSDVQHSLERKGSPYSLVFTKTCGSYERAVKRFAADCKLLNSLPADE